MGRCFARHLLKQSDITNQTVKVPRDGRDREETHTHTHTHTHHPVPLEPSASPPHPQIFSINSCDSGHQLGTKPLITALSTTTALVQYLEPDLQLNEWCHVRHAHTNMAKRFRGSLVQPKIVNKHNPLQVESL